MVFKIKIYLRKNGPMCLRKNGPQNKHGIALARSAVPRGGRGIAFCN